MSNQSDLPPLTCLYLLDSKSGYMYDEKKSKFLTVDSRKSNDGSSDGRSSNGKGESRSEASRKGTGDSDDSDKSKSKRDDSSRNVARSPSISASRPQSNTKQQSRSSNNHRHKSRSSDTKWSNDTDESKRKKTKKSQSDPGGIFTPRGSTSAVNTSSPTPEDSLFAPTLEPEMTCDAKMRKCGRERRPIYALDLEDYIN